MSGIPVKNCWPWSHKWTKWVVEDGIYVNRSTGDQQNAMIQIRHCTKCGFSQVEGVAGR